MARLAHNLEFHTPAQLQLDQKGAAVDEDDFSVLDENILDCHTPAMSPDEPQRRESFVDSASAFSPIDGGWSAYQYSADHVSVQPSGNPPHNFIPQPNSSLSRPEGSRSMAYPSQAPMWPLDSTSGSCTPTAIYEGLMPDYENHMRASYTNNAVHPTQPNSHDGLHIRTGPVYPANAPVSNSPQSGKDWMSVSSSEQLELRSMSGHARSASSSYQGSSPLLRRDGIRKKNARFEIPAERNLRTIDHLINQTNDEIELKELKQQKRLLRNRQAALDSRQRKKQHTERLEEEKKHYTTLINELEESLGEMKVHEADWVREKETWATSQQQYKQYIDTLLMEKEDLVRCHTIESGDLRKKNAYLSEQIQRLESTSMSAAPSSTGFSADFSDFDPLTMNSSPWDNFSMVNDFSMETEPVQHDHSLVISPKKERQLAKDDERGAASGLLLMLLLCGAWMASNSSGPSAISVPRMPEDIRVASATVLDNIYKDAGIPLGEPPSKGGSSNIQAKKTSSPCKSQKTTLSAFEIASLSTKTPLESLHRQLVDPSKEQQRDQLFSLSTDQYIDISSDDYLNDRKPSSGHIVRRRPLSESLAAVRNNAHDTAAEAYTRSLMWDRVPTEVVKDFARLVADSGRSEATRAKNEEHAN